MLFIDGTWRGADSNATFETSNPATGEVVGTVADAGAGDVEAAIAAADAAFSGWAGETAYVRSAMLRDAYSLMVDRKERLAKLMTEEQGKPLKAARNEVQYAADFLLWFSEEAKRVYGSTIPAPRSDQRFITMQQPVGVVGAITPWNYPISMVTRKVAPALAAGCTIVLKPAEQTPLCAIEVFEILDEVGLPAGVANLVPTSDPVPIGEAFTSDPRIAKVTFTGSTEVGKILATQAAPHMKRMSFELGGHAPFIVFEDADPVHAAKGAGLVKFLNTGQACISPNRMYVHASIADQFIETLVARTSALRVGNGLEDGVAIGPLVDQPSLDKVQRQVDDAVEKGAMLHVGGKPAFVEGPGSGFFFEPTVLSNVNADMVISHEETFGPVAPVILFEDEDEVIAAANDTTYGLAAYVYTNNLSRGMRMFEALNFGIIGINDINPTAAAAPFGGMKHSGFGREGGREGIAEYLETKTGGFSL